MRTIGGELARYKGLGPGFDFLRVGLAAGIVLTHAFLQSGNKWIETTPFWFVEYALVPMFFALSGFLVTASACRLSLKNFLINRAFRIVPALAVDIFICALIIGPLMTTLPLAEYFGGRDFARYFLNITGWIHFELPGVFKDHPSDKVNGALWTVPYEILCYLIMSALMITTIVRRPRTCLAVAIGYMCIGLSIQYLTPVLPHAVATVARFAFVNRGSQLITGFLFGIVAYQYRDRIPYSPWLAAAVLVLCVATALTLDLFALGRVGNRFILIPALVYLTAFIGVTRVPIPRFLHTGDYSYGIYLYHDPLLQVIVALVPGLVLTPLLGPWILFLLGLPAVTLLATFSWHVIEKPILGLRKKFSFVARVRGVADAGETGVAPTLTPALADEIGIAKPSPGHPKPDAPDREAAFKHA